MTWVGARARFLSSFAALVAGLALACSVRHAKAAATEPVAKDTAAKDTAAKDAAAKDAAAKDAASQVAAAKYAASQVAAAKDAGARDAGACAASFKHAQRERKRNALVSAQQELLACGQPSCPEAIQTKCVAWLDEVRLALPSIIVTLTDHTGEDVAAAELSIDGRTVASRLDGTPRELDPGSHELRVAVDGRGVTTKIVVVQGVKLRRVALRLPPPVVAPVPETDGGGIPMPSRVGFGIGAALALVGAITGTVAMVRGAELRDECEGSVCYRFQKDDYIATRAVAHASTVSLALAGASLATGVVGLFFAPATAAQPHAAAPAAALLVPTTAGIAWRF